MPNRHFLHIDNFFTVVMVYYFFVSKSIFSNESNSNLILRFFFDNLRCVIPPAHCQVLGCSFSSIRSLLRKTETVLHSALFSENKYAGNFLEAMPVGFYSQSFSSRSSATTNAACFECFSNLFCVIYKLSDTGRTFCLYQLLTMLGTFLHNVQLRFR